MSSLWPSILFVLLALARSDQTPESQVLRGHHTQTSEPDVQQIRSPLLEVFMQLPANFHDVSSLREGQPNGQTPPADSGSARESIVDVRKYQITQPLYLEEANGTRTKRGLDPQEPKTTLDNSEPEKLVSATAKDHPMLPVPDAIRGPAYKTFSVKEFDVVDIDDPDDPRRRRVDSSSDPEDNTQRDKRTFLEEGSGESTTPLPFWKRKKESPPFVTGRVGSIQTGNDYTPAQHRAESTRESHSLKNLDKAMQSNEISRSNQDSYHSATNRRTYSRQYDGPTSSTPKSVYDTIDYSNKPTTDAARGEFPSRQDDKDTTRDTRPQTHEQYSAPHHPPPWMYDRPYYQPSYPYPAEILGRGVEYYHRTYDPTTGRIIYYANMPDQARSYDHRLLDPVSRSFYFHRPYPFDPYYRNYAPPFDYKFGNNFVRTGRSGSQAYSYPFQEREKFPRDARFFGGFETGNRLKDDFRNKTYVIYDADESRSQFSRPQHTADNNRLAYTTPPGKNNPSRPQFPLPFPPPPGDFFPTAAFPNRNNNFYSTGWGGFGHRTLSGVANSRSNSRPLHSPEVQLPLTVSDRGELDKSKKS